MDWMDGWMIVATTHYLAGTMQETHIIVDTITHLILGTLFRLYC